MRATYTCSRTDVRENKHATKGVEISKKEGQITTVHQFENFDYSGLIISVCLSIHICVRYEGSVVNHTDTGGNYSEKNTSISKI